MILTLQSLYAKNKKTLTKKEVTDPCPSLRAKNVVHVNCWRTTKIKSLPRNRLLSNNLISPAALHRLLNSWLISPKTSIPVTAKLCLLQPALQCIHLLLNVKERPSIFEPQGHISRCGGWERFSGNLFLLQSLLNYRWELCKCRRHKHQTKRIKHSPYASLTLTITFFRTSVNSVLLILRILSNHLITIFALLKDIFSS